LKLRQTFTMIDVSGETILFALTRKYI